jgi:hypothetical protein
MRSRTEVLAMVNLRKEAPGEILNDMCHREGRESPPVVSGKGILVISGLSRIMYQHLVPEPEGAICPKFEFRRFLSGSGAGRQTKFLGDNSLRRCDSCGWSQAAANSSGAAEKFGELGNAGFEQGPFWKQSFDFVLVAHAPQGRQHVGE